jgi:hypothetical protein
LPGPRGDAGAQQRYSPLHAVLALAARVDHAADPDAVADRVLGHLRADLANDARDLVTGYGGIRHLAPLAAAMVDVGVADAAELDVDQTSRGPTPRRSMVSGASGSLADGAP